MIVGMNPMDREVIWQRVYNLLRDHGRKGMPIQSLSGVDIALWDACGKILGLPVYQLLGGSFRNRIPVYGYGMMLKRTPGLEEQFADEALRLVESGFRSIR